MSENRAIQTIKAAGRVSTPLLACSTPDQWAFVEMVRVAMAGQAVMLWDCIRGIRPLGNTPENAQAFATLGSNVQQVAQETASPIEALVRAEKLPGRSVLVMMNANSFVERDPAGLQATSNLRDQYKKDRRMLLLLDSHFRLPAALQSDVVTLEDALPTDEQALAILHSIYKASKIAPQEEAVLRQAVDAARGLSAFAVEQVYAMSMRATGLDLDDCWLRKEAAVNQTAGLTFSRGGFSFDDLGGLEQIKKFLRRRFAGVNPPRVVIFQDEIDKSVAGAETDLSGVSADAYGQQLQWMEDGGHDGMLFLGPAGSGKTALARAVARQFGIPMIKFDHGAQKGSLVGESERMVRAAHRVCDGVAGQGGALIIATCNKIDVLPAPLRRRFLSGIHYFDLPTPEEQDPMWTINLKRFGLDENAKRPDYTDWTGAEIRNACKIAHEHRCSLMEAAESIVPVALADAAGVAKLRSLAHGRFLSVSHPGPYLAPNGAETTAVGPTRAMLVTATEVETQAPASVKKTTDPSKVN